MVYGMGVILGYGVLMSDGVAMGDSILTSRGGVVSGGSPFLNCGVLMGDGVVPGRGAGVKVKAFSKTGRARGTAYRHRARRPGGSGNPAYAANVTATPPG